MDKINGELISLFDEMLTHIKEFKHKTYNNIIEKAYDKHKDLISRISRICEEADDEERAALIEEIAGVIPAYAYERMQKEPKRSRERYSVDYNMNMAVYVVPLLTYTHDTYCEAVAKKMVKIWNEKQVTTLTLGLSSYETIAGGFKKKLCYITTAVCESRNQPDDCYELETLRNYRDTYLMQTEEGRTIVEEYYEIAPGIVTILNMQKDVRKVYEEIYRDYLMPCIRYIEDGQKEECKELYMQMVKQLQRQYLYA